MIDVLHVGPLSGSALERHIARGEVIPQVQDRPDRQYPEVRWHQYGVIPTSEVAVTASCGSVAVFAVAPTRLVFPAMADRIHGTDVMDIQLGQQLAEALWRRHGAELAAQALVQRTGRR